MNTLERSKQFIETQFATPIMLCSSPAECFALFEQLYCFNTTLQSTYTQGGLQKFRDATDRHTIYEVHEQLDTVTLRFFINDIFLIFGPYTETEWDALNGQTILNTSGVPISFLNAYKLYRSQFSVLETQYVVRALAAMIETEGVLFTEYRYQKVDVSADRRAFTIEVPPQYSSKQAYDGYALEKKFMDAISSGEEAKAISLYQTMGRSVSEANLSIAKSSSYHLVATTIMRTIVRLAAEKSGLSPLVIEGITESYAQKLGRLGRAPSGQESNQLTTSMIRELCREINKLPLSNYSPLVRKAIQYIHLNLGHDLSLPTIAEETNVSSGYLSKIFVSETRLGVSMYIRRERCKKAASLLASTNHSVQNICNYIGFTDANYFVKIFKKEYGSTPSAYRIEMQK